MFVKFSGLHDVREPFDHRDFLNAGAGFIFSVICAMNPESRRVFRCRHSEIVTDNGCARACNFKPFAERGVKPAVQRGDAFIVKPEDAREVEIHADFVARCGENLRRHLLKCPEDSTDAVVSQVAEAAAGEFLHRTDIVGRDSIPIECESGGDPAEAT